MEAGNPKADIPVVQLSVNGRLSAWQSYENGQKYSINGKAIQKIGDSFYCKETNHLVITNFEFRQWS
ncbi:MAG: hypothetical protein ACI4ET_10930 [Bilifractor sp.]